MFFDAYKLSSFWVGMTQFSTCGGGKGVVSGNTPLFFL